MKYIKSFEGIVTELDYSNQHLFELPGLPVTLTKLPTLPDGLIYLNCCDNNFIEFPTILPKSLIGLSCGGNNLPYNNIVEYYKWLEMNHPEVVIGNKFNI